MTKKKHEKRQTEIKGAEAPKIDELDEIAGPYTEALYSRQSLQDKENALKSQLLDRMKAKGMDRYVYRDGEARFILTLEEQSKVRCKREKQQEAA